MGRNAFIRSRVSNVGNATDSFQQTNLAKYVKNGKAGYVINNLTVSELNKKIKTILKDKINKKLMYKGVSARKMALKYFSWENTVSLLNKNIYSKIYK